jgi:hypothetical protein
MQTNAKMHLIALYLQVAEVGGPPHDDPEQQQTPAQVILLHDWPLERQLREGVKEVGATVGEEVGVRVGDGALVGEEVVGGVGVGGVRNPTTLSRPPVTTLPTREGVGFAALSMAALVSAADAKGLSAL